MDVEALRKLGCGVYTLIINLSRNLRLRVGSLGLLDFPRGFYSYTGSALGPSRHALYYRVKRHLSKSKKLRWHIDYLTINDFSEILAVIAASSSSKIECKISSLLSNFSDVITIYKFGSMDCRSNICIGHLHFYLLNNFNKILLLIRNIYCSLGLNHKIFLSYTHK